MSAQNVDLLVGLTDLVCVFEARGELVWKPFRQTSVSALPVALQQVNLHLHLLAESCGVTVLSLPVEGIAHFGCASSVLEPLLGTFFDGCSLRPMSPLRGTCLALWRGTGEAVLLIST
jgi:hypothetical protein